MKNHSLFTLLDEASNPLASCPDSPNCVRRTYRTSSKKEYLYPPVIETLEKMGAISIDEDAKERIIKAVFKVVFFKDDVALKLEPKSDHTLLHIRSASRTGHYDFGVNKRRVNKIIKTLSASISNAHG